MDKSLKIKSNFFSRNLVTLVMIPAIIGFHLGWSVIQKNRTLVREDEESDLPVVTFYKYCVRKLTAEERPTKLAAVKTENP